MTNSTIAQHSNPNALHGIINIHMQIYKSVSAFLRDSPGSCRRGAEVSGVKNLETVRDQQGRSGGKGGGHFRIPPDCWRLRACMTTITIMMIIIIIMIIKTSDSVNTLTAASQPFKSRK